ncbi:MAG: hypothetical protein K6347_04145 [Campylobacterales bacterium]
MTLYELLTTIYLLLPPLLALLAFRLYEHPSRMMVVVVAIYLWLFEVERGGVMFVGWGVLFLFLAFIMPFIASKLICHNCLPFVGMALFYLLYDAAISLSHLIFASGMVFPPLYLGYYLATEVILYYLAGR